MFSFESVYVPSSGSNPAQPFSMDDQDGQYGAAAQISEALGQAIMEDAFGEFWSWQVT
jgi:hypothetical protein